MKTEKELKNRCTLEFIKWCCEYAEGFSYHKNYRDNEFYLDFNRLNTGDKLIEILDDYFYFALFIHRTIGGYSKKIFINYVEKHIAYNKLLGNTTYYKIEDYQQEKILTQLECTMLDCLLDIYTEVTK